MCWIFSNRRATAVACFFIFVCFASLGVAGDREAIQYYESALQAMDSQQYEAALADLKKALAHRSEDAIIDHPDEKQTSWAPYGRGLQQVVTYSSFEYYPNAQLAKVQGILEYQHRIKYPPNLILHWIGLTEPSEDNILDGGELGIAMFLLENVGLSNAFDVILELSCQSCEGIDFDDKLQVGSVPAGETKLLSMNVTSQRDIQALDRHFKVIAHEDNGFDSNILAVVLQTRPYRPPALVLDNIQMHDSSGDSKISAQEIVRIKAKVKNVGEGIAESVNADVVFGEHVFLGPRSTQHFNVGTLMPGEGRDIEFSFFTNRRLREAKKIPVSIGMTEKEGKFGHIEDLDLYLAVPMTQLINVAEAFVGMNGLDGKQLNIDNQIPLGNIQKKHAVAVVIGNKNYKSNGVPDVNYAHNDAHFIKEYLVKALGYDRANIIYLLDATAARFNETFGNESNPLGKLYSYVKPLLSDVFIYYSGHGAPGLTDNNAYFVPADVDPNYIATSGYSLQTFYKNIARIPARHVTIVLDTCFSGNSAAGFLLNNVSPAFIKVKDKSPSIRNAAVFTSAMSDQVSSWYPEKRHSLFTYFFLKGLSGQADSNQDNKIMTSELGVYLKAEVPYHALRIAGSEQEPHLQQEQDSLVFEFKRTPQDGAIVSQ